MRCSPASSTNLPRAWRAVLAAVLVTASAGGAAATSARAPIAADAAPTTVTLDQCSWDRPGVNPFMGDVVGAVDRYQDIPPEVRARLKARMAKREYDDIVSIKRDSIDGQAGQQYSNVISDMHFGTHQVCRSVTRASWTAAMQERGLVYCESGRCILVPTICRNVSRVSRKGVSPEHADAPDDAGPIAEVPALPADPSRALAIDNEPSFAEPLAHLRDAGPVGAVPGIFGGPFEGETAAPGGGAPPLVSGPIPGFPGGSSAAASGPSDGGFVPPSPPPPIVGGLTTPVPEPQAWALMVLGLGALAFVAKRRAARR